jgi:regulator of sirC expression with transglutaminase-like and TPR domain
MPTHPARRRFRAQLARPNDNLNLADAALCVAWEDRGHGDPDATLFKLDLIAAGAGERIGDSTHPPTIVAALGGYLFEDMGFRGNNWNYTDPQNSYVDHVIEARVGLPITLSLIYLEVGWRLGLPLVGVALPGHFIVRYLTSQGSIFIDPFQRGRIWSYHECEAQVRRHYGRANEELMRLILEPPSRRAILARMIRNLKAAYAERGEFEQAYAAVERIILIEGENAAEIRDRGLLHARLNRLHRALDDLDTYAQREPNATDLDLIRQHAETISTLIGPGN